MDVSRFIQKWRDHALTERQSYQQHFLDLCELVGHPKPAEVDKTGETFCFEKGAGKLSGGKGWADVWKRGFFGCEYKKRHKDLDAAYRQLLEYREQLENPPLLVCCDTDRIVVHTNFTSARNVVHEIPLLALGEPRNFEIVRAVFHDPDRLRPGMPSQAITEEAAARLAGIAQSLRDRGLDPLEVARFLDRIVFCLFADDIGLLPEKVFSALVERSRDDPVLDLTPDEIDRVYHASRLDWSAVDPSIFGTLFERGMDPDKRSQIGAHYTSREDIQTLVEPVVMAPLRREWNELRTVSENLLTTGKKRGDGGSRPPTGARLQKARAEAGRLVRRFHHKLTSLKVLDPACGSGNFLYVTLQKLMDLEQEVIAFAAERRLEPLAPMVGPWQLYGIEINAYAYDLAQMVVWIGYLQWLYVHGRDWPPEPILKPMAGNFQHKDAILDLTDADQPREPAWPKVDYIVGNPPFLGDKLMRRGLGDEYVEALRRLYAGRLPGQSDLCCYWFEKARAQIEQGKCKRAGLLATQGIRGGANREVLKRIKRTGDIFFAESDRPWVLDGANVHVSMVGFDDGFETIRQVDGRHALAITRALNAAAGRCDPASARPLVENGGICHLGVMKAGHFELDPGQAAEMVQRPNPHGRPNSDVLRPRMNARDILQRTGASWIVDFGCDMGPQQAAMYEGPWQHVVDSVKPYRESNKRKRLRQRWWLHGEPRPGLRRSLARLPRFLVTPEVSKHRVFVWLDGAYLADHQTRAFARSDDYFFGVLHSRIHEVWARAQGTQLRERESGFRYTPTTCPGRRDGSPRTTRLCRRSPGRRGSSTSCASAGSTRRSGRRPRCSSSRAAWTARGRGTCTSPTSGASARCAGLGSSARTRRSTGRGSRNGRLRTSTTSGPRGSRTRIGSSTRGFSRPTAGTPPWRTRRSWSGSSR